MQPGSCSRGVLLAVMSFSAAAASAATVWDEASAGDFSANGLAPTPVVMALGSNTVVGSVGDSGNGIDRDYFRFTVPDGAALNSILLLPNTTVSGGASFIAIQAGPQLTVSPTGVGVANLLGFAHYANDQIGTDLLPTLALNFTGALPSGVYSVWVQETGGPAAYGLNFGIAAVPEPGAAALLLAGLLGLSIVRRR